MSQATLAQKANVSQQLVSQIENGKNRDTTRLPEFAAALGCPVEAIDPDFYLLPDDADRAVVVDRFKQVLGLHDEAAMRELDGHLRYLLHQYQAHKDDTPEENPPRQQ